MDCLQNLIGITPNCGDLPVPTSDVWLDRLPGINLRMADALVSEEVQSGYRLLQNSITEAGEYLKNDLLNHLSGTVKRTSLIEADTAGHYPDNLPVMDMEAGQWKGVELRIEDLPNAALHINSIRLQAQTTGDVAVKFYDLITGKEVHSVTVPAVADEVTEVTVNKTFPCWDKRVNLLIIYDATTISSYNTPVYALNGKWWGVPNCNSCSELKKYACAREYVYVRGAKIADGSQKIRRNVSAQSYTAGLSVSYSLVCSAEPLICRMAVPLAWPLRYKAGALIMQEALVTQRINSVVLNKKDTWEALANLYQSKYEESLNSLLQNLPFAGADPCMQCRGAVKFKTMIP